MKKNQLLALLLAAVMLLAVLTGCASKTEPAPVEPAQTETAPEAETATPEEDPAPAEEPEAEDASPAVTLTAAIELSATRSRQSVTKPASNCAAAVAARSATSSAMVISRGMTP